MIKTISGVSIRYRVERVYTLRVYVAIAYIYGDGFRLDDWRELDKRKLKRIARKGLQFIK